MFKIGEFARINRVTTKTLRYYEKIGLISPYEVNDANGYRYYSASQIPSLNRILVLKELGFSMSEISELHNNEFTNEQMIGILKVRKVKTKEIVLSEENRLKKLDNFIKLFNTEVDVMYDVLLKRIDGFRVASVRDIVKDYGDQGHLWGELVEHIEKNKAKILPGCFVSYHNEEGGIDIEIFEPIDKEIISSERIDIKILPDVDEMACVIHEGPYETLNLAYSAITQWIENNDYKITGLNREIYLKGEWNSESDDQYITEIQFPVTK